MVITLIIGPALEAVVVVCLVVKEVVGFVVTEVEVEVVIVVVVTTVSFVVVVGVVLVV